MDQTDLLYRAFRDLTSEIDENRGVTAMEGNFANAREPDKITVVHNVCKVEEDWVAAIERGIVFIGRAIEEDRQFIRSNGEVQPIEKVKHISRESVQHLSRHSDFISRQPEQKGDIIPDKLYTVERLNDYTVYENRFLYLLLCRVRDFVSVRYEAIMRAYKLYRGELASHKKVVTGTRRLSYELTFTDEQDDVFAADADPACASYLDRIEKIQQSVAFFLRTPLMVEVSRVDKIKSKITKTNVLRMDKNFKEAVTLYEFLLAYDRDGYTIQREEKSLDPVPLETAKELAVPALLASFLVYEHGLGVENRLQEEFDKEEARRAEAKQRALVEAIRQLKKRIEETGKGMEEYMLLLEERNAALEQDSILLQQARVEIENLNGTIDRMEMEARALQTEIDGLNDENSKLKDTLSRIEEEHRRKIEEMVRERQEAEAALKREHEKALADAEEKRIADLAAADERAKEEIARMKQSCEETLNENRLKMEEGEAKRKDAEETLESVKHERDVYMARLTAVRSEHGLLTAADDFTTEAGFNALEHEFETLGRLVRKQWTDVKKILKKEFSDSIRAVVRGKKGQKSDEYRKLSAEVQARRPRPEPAPKPKPAAPNATAAKANEQASKPAAKPNEQAAKPAAPNAPAAKPNEQAAKPAAKPTEQAAKPAAPKTPAAPAASKPAAPAKPSAQGVKQATQTKPKAPTAKASGVKEQTERNGQVPTAGTGTEKDKTKK